MKLISRSSSIVTLLSAAAILGAIAHPARAQVNNPADSAGSPAQAGPTEGSSDPFSNTGNGGINSMFDLIHRANYGEIRSSGEFQQDQRNNIRSEAEAFRARQLELLRQQQQATPPATNTPPATTTP